MVKNTHRVCCHSNVRRRRTSKFPQRPAATPQESAISPSLSWHARQATSGPETGLWAMDAAARCSRCPTAGETVP